MKMLLIMAASCLVTFGTAQVFATDASSGATAGKDQPADAAKDVKSDKSSDASVAKGKAQTNCPVMGGEIDKTKYVDVKGKRIYVCCGGCIGIVKSNPDKYIKMLEDQGIEIEKAPAPKSKKHQ